MGFFGCKKSHKNSSQKIYLAEKTSAKISIDGILEHEWQTANQVQFDYFYGFDKDIDKQKTTFRMLWDDENLYLSYDCEDQYLNAAETQRDGLPFLDDCVEVFLTPTATQNKLHTCFEMNINKALNDIVYLEQFEVGKPGVIKAFNPEIQVEISLQGTINDNSDIDKGYIMEVAIPLRSFKGFDMYQPVKTGNTWSFLAIRQERNGANIGVRKASAIFEIDKLENIHNSSNFGFVKFVDDK